MELTALPGDVLVAVMQLLDVQDLLSCRLACRRLGDLALHPDAWRRRALDFGSRCICPVLRLAPCALSIRIKFPVSFQCDLSATIASSICAAKGLRVRVGDACDDNDGLDAKALILQQQALGRLKELRLKLVLCTKRVESLLLLAVASMSGLEKLSVNMRREARKPNSIPSSNRITPSLKFFHCDNQRCWPFIHRMLSGHAATLETVQVPLLRPPHSIVPMLAGMPKLTSLKCDCMPGIKDVLACASLKELHLVITYFEVWVEAEANLLAAEGVVEAAELLRRAEHLRSVTLEYNSPLFTNELHGVDLVLALVSSGRSRLETLCISYECPTSRGFPQLKPLLSALPRLPALLHLKVATASDVVNELLSAISPATAPSLQSVDLPVRGMCVQSWIRGDVAKAAFSTNPSLHITSEFSLCSEEDEDACEICKLVWRREQYSIGLFSHDPKGECLLGHSSDHMWIHVPL